MFIFAPKYTLLVFIRLIFVNEEILMSVHILAYFMRVVYTW